MDTTSANTKSCAQETGNSSLIAPNDSMCYSCSPPAGGALEGCAGVQDSTVQYSRIHTCCTGGQRQPTPKHKQTITTTTTTTATSNNSLCVPSCRGVQGFRGIHEHPAETRRSTDVYRWSPRHWNGPPGGLCVTENLRGHLVEDGLTCGPATPLSPGLPGLPLLPCVPRQNQSLTCW